jgi:hypothetical protein
VLRSISANCGSFGGSCPLGLRHTFFNISVEVGCNVMATLVNLGVDHSVGVVSMSFLILVQPDVRRVGSLSLLKFVKPFIAKLHFKLLFNPSVGILSDIPISL